VEAYRPRPGEEDLRGWEWYYLRKRCHSDLTTLRQNSAQINVLRFLPGI
jgi:hypothetical protein